jgi:glycosyltransferase involved in cell wall biosynthesis
VHANGVKAAVVAVLATIGGKPPVVWVRHDFSYDGRVARAVSRRCRVTVCVSSVLSRGIIRARVVETPLLSDTSGDARRLGVPDDTPLVGMLGYFHPVKGQAELVELAPAVLERVPAAHFLFVGGEDPSTEGYTEHVKTRARELGVAAAFTFGGHRSDGVAILRGCDAAVVLTLGRGEGFGLVALEALAVGTPLVAYANGALPELVGPCARLVAPGDRHAAANALADVLLDEDLRARLAACGRERVAQRPGRDNWVRSMISSYREAV